MFRFHSLLLRSVLLLGAVSLRSFAQPTVETITTTAAGVLPGPTTVTGQDGYLYGIVTAGSGNGGGYLYRVAPGGKVQILHRFPSIANNTKPNVGGYGPVGAPLVGNDGYLYGLAEFGGAYADGVIYRIRTDGQDFSTYADLDASKFPDGSYQVQPLGPDSILGGSYQDFFFTTNRRAIAKVGLFDGLSVVANRGGTVRGILNTRMLPTDGTELFNEFAVVSLQDGAVTVEIVNSDGSTDGSYSSPTGLIGANQVFEPLQMVKAGLIFASGVADGSDVIGRYSLLSYDGSVRVIGSVLKNQADANTLRARFRYAEGEGDTVYMMAGGPALSDAHTLLKYTINGLQSIVAGFPDGLTSGSLVAHNNESTYFAASSATGIVTPHDGNLFWSPAWMDKSNAANYDVTKIGRHGVTWFQISPFGGTLRLDALANVDAIVAKKGVATYTVPVLKNDRPAPGNSLNLRSAGGGTGIGGPTGNSVSVEGNSLVFTNAKGNDQSWIASYYLLNDPIGTGEEIGTVLFRGDISGHYLDPTQQVRKKPLSIRVAANGRFTTIIPDGKGRFVPVSGMTDCHDFGTAAVRERDGSVVRFTFLIGDDGNGDRLLGYNFQDATGAVIYGSATLQ